jgi:leucyl aminopeptidase (aminopeptidase T)
MGSQAARQVVSEVLGIVSGETVLISSDSTETQSVSRLLAGAVLLQGGEPIEVLTPPTPYPGSPVPTSLQAVARASDVWIELNEHYILGSKGDHEARDAGLRRFYSLSGISVEDLITLELDINRSVIAALGARLADLTSGARVLRVTCRNGSDFVASCEDRIAEPDLLTMSLGQTHVTPAGATGRLVFDGSAFPPASLGRLRTSITVDFGQEVSIASGGRESDVARGWQASIEDASLFRLNHFSYGYHPNVMFATGRLVNDERVFGCLCVGLGPPQPYSCHMDLTLLSPTVEIDGEVIEIDGKYVDPELRELCAALRVPGY